MHKQIQNPDLYKKLKKAEINTFRAVHPHPAAGRPALKKTRQPQRDFSFISFG